MNMELQEMVEKLQEAAYFEGSELGEYWDALCNLQYKIVLANEDFKNAWEKEVKDHYNYLIENYKIIETVKTVEITDRQLEFTGEI